MTMLFSRNAIVVARRAALSRTSRSCSQRRAFWSSRIMQDGTLEMVVGGSLLAAVAVDRLLVYQQSQERDRFMDELRNAETRSPEDLNEMEEWFNMPDLFDCIIRKMPLNLDGYKCLGGVQLGDVVQVLDEKVGPSGMYNLCRKLDDKGRPVSAGWFPTMYLEKK